MNVRAVVSKSNDLRIDSRRTKWLPDLEIGCEFAANGNVQRLGTVDSKYVVRFSHPWHPFGRQIIYEFEASCIFCVLYV